MADSVTLMVNHQTVAPYEANLIAQAEQKRLVATREPIRLLARLRSTINRLDYTLARYASDLRDASAEAAGPNRPYTPDVAAAFYWTAVCVLLCLELALNKGAVEQLHMIPLHAWATAGFISMMNFVAAKSTARVLRRRPWLFGVHVDWMLALAATTVIMIALYQLGVLRALDASADAGTAATDALSIGGEFASSIAGSTASARVAPPLASPWTFVCLQAAGYLAVMLLSYFQLDPLEERAQLTKRVVKLEQRVEQLWRARAGFAATHNATLVAARHDLAEIAHDLQERVAQYRDANMRARLGEDVPALFRVAISHDVLRPIDLGALIDEHPRTSGQVTGATLLEEESA